MKTLANPFSNVRVFIGLLLLAVGILSGCKQNPFDDNDLIKLLDYKDRRDSLELIETFTNSKSALKLRVEAVKAMGEIQPLCALTPLKQLLENQDEKTDLRVQAAYALGQYRDSLNSDFLISNAKQAQSAILSELIKSIGKSGGKESAHFLSNFTSKDKKIKNSHALALAYLSKNTPQSPINTELLMSYLNSDDEETAIYAAIALNGFKNQLTIEQIKAVTEKTKIAGAQFQFFLLRILKNKQTDTLQSEIVGLLNSVKQQNLDAFIELLTPEAAMKLSSELTKKSLNQSAEMSLASKLAAVSNEKTVNEFKTARAKAIFYAILAEKECKSTVSDTVFLNKQISLYNQTFEPYDKAFVLAKLVASIHAFPFLENEWNSTEELIIRQKAFERILGIRKHTCYAELKDAWTKQFPKQADLNKYFASILNQAISGRDVGLLAQASEFISDDALPEIDAIRKLISSDALLYSFRNLNLPRDIEIYQEMKKAIEKLTSMPIESYKPKTSNSIDWAYIKRLPSKVEVEFKTNKGTIELVLETEKAPATVAQFCRLVGTGFYDGKVFHRVVPHFVIQTGCPRGDGFGSTNDVLRSEFSNETFSYGSVGLASAGKDTESCQFFITTATYPHLNGRYTLFGKVSKGMEVVEKIVEGDKIIQADFKR